MTDPKRPRGRPRATSPRKQMPLIQVRASAEVIAFLEEAAWAKHRPRARYVLEAALRDAARVLQRPAPKGSA